MHSLTFLFVQIPIFEINPWKSTRGSFPAQLMNNFSIFIHYSYGRAFRRSVWNLFLDPLFHTLVCSGFVLRTNPSVRMSSQTAIYGTRPSVHLCYPPPATLASAALHGYIVLVNIFIVNIFILNYSMHYYPWASLFAVPPLGLQRYINCFIRGGKLQPCNQRGTCS